MNDLEQIKQILLDPILRQLQKIEDNIEKLFAKYESIEKVKQDVAVMEAECNSCKKERVLFELELKQKIESVEKKIISDEENRKNSLKNNLQLVIYISGAIAGLGIIGGFLSKVFK